MTTEIVLPVSREAIQARSQQQQEPTWLQELRLQAIELAESLSLPALDKTRIDRWKLDNYGQYRTAQPLVSLDELPEQAQELINKEEAGSLLVQRGSSNVYAQVSEALSEQGVLFMDMDTAVREHGDLVQKHLMQVIRADENRITALHAALWSGGVFIYVPRNVQVEVPLQALFLLEGDDACAPHILIIAEENSSVVYVDDAISIGTSDQTLVHHCVVEVIAQAGARVQFSSVHHLSASQIDLTYRRAELAQDARIEWIIGEMNDGNTLSDTTSILRGNGSTSDALVLTVGTGDQRADYTTRAIHFGRNSDSQMLTRAVMRDNSTAIINGITKIEHGATNANGEQTEKVMMLSPTARGDANPMLLIDEDEVTAGHAASVGQVDPNQVYYLMSRGISKEDAERLIINGFLAPIVRKVPIAKVADQLQYLVERKLSS